MTHVSGPDESTRARAVLAELRPQAFGSGAPSRVLDPIVEPQWTGIRALVAVDAERVTIVGPDGEPLEGFELIEEALVGSAPGDELVLDGVITRQAVRATGAVAPWSDEMPSMGSFLGLRRNRAVDTVQLKEQAIEASTFDTDEDLALVVTDLLWLDGTSLLDIPLLERRRLLEGAVSESDAVRLGVYVRPPIERWVVSWRSQGFTGLTYKAANSRYLPGRPNPDWVIAGMPRR